MKQVVSTVTQDETATCNLIKQLNKFYLSKDNNVARVDTLTLFFNYIIEVVVCSDAELDCIKLRGVYNVLPTPCANMRGSVELLSLCWLAGNLTVTARVQEKPGAAIPL